MKKSQLNAIEYAKLAKKAKKREEYMQSNNLYEEFKNSKYKTIRTFLQYSKHKNF